MKTIFYKCFSLLGILLLGWLVIGSAKPAAKPVDTCGSRIDLVYRDGQTFYVLVDTREGHPVAFIKK